MRRPLLFQPPTTQAITDMYDTKRHTALVRYPLPVLIALSLTGAGALLVTGFLGYSDDPAAVKPFFQAAWPLFLWLCGVLLLLQVSILRHPSLRRGALAVGVVTLGMFALVGAWEYAALQPVQVVTRVLTPLAASDSGVPIYVIINVGVLALFGADAIRRWLGRGRQVATVATTSGAEMVCGDLIAGGVLALVLAWIFQPSVIRTLSHLLASAHVLDLAPTVHTVAPPACSLALSGCSTAPNSPSLAFLDLTLALILLSLGVFILALSAVFNGLTALGDTGKGPALADSGSEADIISRSVVGTVASALNRRIQLAMENIGVGLRLVAWPLMTFISVFSAATTAHYIWRYLHDLSDSHTCHALNCPTWPQQLVQSGLFEGLALVGLVVTLVTAVGAVALFVGSWRVVDNTLRYLRLVAFIGLLTFWLFSLALSGCNGVLYLMGISPHVPFPQPGLLTIVSFGALLGYALLLLVRQHRTIAASPTAVTMPGIVTLTTTMPAPPTGSAPVPVRGIERRGT